MSALGTPDNPLRVAVIGSGPSGFYAAEHLFKMLGGGVRVDMFERLPTPYGLVRGGVAPDHPKIKSVTKVYEKTASRPEFGFFGHVEFGTDVTLDDLKQYYHAAIIATGAQTDKPLGIPGEDLPGSHAATEFVAWYNGHPDYRDRRFNLNTERAVVIGVGNVAMDVARILSRTCAELAETDIADYALDALDASRVREIIVLGRRGPAQAAFTPPELKELAELTDAEVYVAPEDALPDPLSSQWLATANDRDAEKNLALLKAYSEAPKVGKPRRIIFKFLASPLEIIGDTQVEKLVIGRNVLVRRDDGSLAAKPSGVTEEIECGLVFRSVGYRGIPLPDVPFDAPSGRIPNHEGRVLDAAGGVPVTGLYAVGWIKRGPSGVIGTNKPDSVETVDRLLEDMQAGRVWSPNKSKMELLLRNRGTKVVSFHDWLKLDSQEVANGAKLGRPRVKFTSVETMLSVLED